MFINYVKVTSVTVGSEAALVCDCKNVRVLKMMLRAIIARHSKSVRKTCRGSSDLAARRRVETQTTSEL